jgi:small conductance mechanosensitive channel
MQPEVYEKLYQRLLGKLFRWLEGVVEMLPNTVVAVLLLLLFWVASVIIGSLTRRALARMNADAAASRLMVTLIRLLVFGAGLFVALGLLGLDKALGSLLAGAGIVGLALGFAFSGSGRQLDQRSCSGDQSRAPLPGWRFGRHQRLPRRHRARRSPLHDHLTLDGKSVIIPNKQVYQSTLVNLTASKKRRVELHVNVDYAANLAQVVDVTLAALETVDPRRKDPPARVYFQRFAESSIELIAWFWIDFRKQEDLLRAQHDGIIAIQRAFARSGIDLPFPIRTLDVRDKAGLAIRKL